MQCMQVYRGQVKVYHHPKKNPIANYVLYAV